MSNYIREIPDWPATLDLRMTGPLLRPAAKAFTIAATCVALMLAAGGCGDFGKQSTQSGDERDGALTPEQVAPVGIEHADRRLRAIAGQAGELLPGGAGAFKSRIASLEGLPVVVNKWASWCPPCAAEFPYFQQQAHKRGARIAFLGVNTNDADDEAAAFLADHPVPFPSYKDPKAEVAAQMRNVVSFPSTAFYDSTGRLTNVHQGQFATEADLADAIDRYALGKTDGR